jgi:hypothetical protein
MVNFGGENLGRQIWVGTASSTNAARQTRRCAATVRALVHVITTDAAHKGSADWALHHSFGRLVS